MLLETNWGIKLKTIGAYCEALDFETIKLAPTLKLSLFDEHLYRPDGLIVFTPVNHGVGRFGNLELVSSLTHLALTIRGDRKWVSLLLALIQLYWESNESLDAVSDFDETWFSEHCIHGDSLNKALKTLKNHSSFLVDFGLGPVSWPSWFDQKPQTWDHTIEVRLSLNLRHYLYLNWHKPMLYRAPKTVA